MPKLGSVVDYRTRKWIVMPSEKDETTFLRPIAGSRRESYSVVNELSKIIAYSLEWERMNKSEFPLPDPAHALDHTAVKLLMQAAQLLLREGATPFRSPGNLSVRPRPYQYVPLLMALRQHAQDSDNEDTPVRMLIADDVGIGKTIEAALIARELLDRGDIQRIGVLCPPYLCNQWHKELTEKFHIDSVVMRTGTVSQLQQNLPANTTVMEHYRHVVASIDLAKRERHKHGFFHHCPDLVIVDEVHGAAQPAFETGESSQQQRYEFLRMLVDFNKDKHFIFLSATPHSGHESSFLSLLGLLKPEFRTYSLAHLNNEQRDTLARHFVQRRRADIKHWSNDTTFPERINEELDYSFTPQFHAFYQHVYDFASQLVRSAETLSGWKQRMRFWSALTLMRCITSSPAAAAQALSKRYESMIIQEVQEKEVSQIAALLVETKDEAQDIQNLNRSFEPLVLDPSDAETTIETSPSTVFDIQKYDETWTDHDSDTLRAFAEQAEELYGDADPKVMALVEKVADMLKKGMNPIIWCRYIATAEYVDNILQRRLESRFEDLGIRHVTGKTPEEHRHMMIDEIIPHSHRILVATDCMSEGVNLQQHFNAIVHYDLPWNPNRLEQREGRVDRFGQTAENVTAVLVFGKDNPVDAAVLDVLLRKANNIQKQLGVRVPVPIDSETVMETVLRSLFADSGSRLEIAQQMTFFTEDDTSSKRIKDFHNQWEQAANREKENRTRFAQRAIHPEEIVQELSATDAVLGGPGEVEAFVRLACERLGVSLRKSQKHALAWQIDTSSLPKFLQRRLLEQIQTKRDLPDRLHIAFESPTPAGLLYIGRNHAFTEQMAEHLMDMAIYPPEKADHALPVSRCGVICTNQVQRRTTLWLLRYRYIHSYTQERRRRSLSEETLIWGFEGLVPNNTELSLEAAQALFDEAQPTANVAVEHKREVLEETIAWWNHTAMRAAIKRIGDQRGVELQDSFRRVRKILRQGKERIEPFIPPDPLGVLVLLPPTAYDQLK